MIRTASRYIVLIFCAGMLNISCVHQKPEISVLVFTKTNGYHHQSISAGFKAIRSYPWEKRVAIDSTSDSLLFDPAILSKYDAVVFLNTSGNVLGPEQEEAFRSYIETGGDYVGIHGASDTEYNWPWYGNLVGTYFMNHPKIQPARLQILGKNHPSTHHLPDIWNRTDEWYNFRTPLDPSIHILISLDENSYEGGKNGSLHPFCWYHKVGKGRAWYTAGGHLPENYRDPDFIRHLAGGILYAAGSK